MAEIKAIKSLTESGSERYIFAYKNGRDLYYQSLIIDIPKISSGKEAKNTELLRKFINNRHDNINTSFPFSSDTFTNASKLVSFRYLNIASETLKWLENPNKDNAALKNLYDNAEAIHNAHTKAPSFMFCSDYDSFGPVLSQIFADYNIAFSSEYHRLQAEAKSFVLTEQITPC